MIRPRNALISTMAAVAVAIAGAGAAPAYAATSTASTADSVPSVQLSNVYTGKCLDAIDSTPNGGFGMANLFSCTNSSDYYTQHWQIILHPGYVQIVLTQWPTYCLDGVEGTGGVTEKTCISGDLHQHWIETKVADGILTFEDSANDECLDGTTEYGVRVITCGEADDHQWWE
jgi:Ricin-type beta-trefoil lectin domain